MKIYAPKDGRVAPVIMLPVGGPSLIAGQRVPQLANDVNVEGGIRPSDYSTIVGLIATPIVTVVGGLKFGGLQEEAR